MQLTNATVSLFESALDETTRNYTWKKHLLEGVSWYMRSKSTVTDDGLKAANEYIVRIPFRGEWTLKKGDYIVLGDGENVPNPRETYGDDCMTILAVTDNFRAPRGQHFKVVGA